MSTFKECNRLQTGRLRISTARLYALVICLTSQLGLSQTFSVLHSFVSSTDGGDPQGGLVSSGEVLYGTTSVGGIHGFGTVFKVGIDGSGYTVLHSFAGGNDGANPKTPLILSSDGMLYGTTWAGGIFSLNPGTIFRIGTDGTGYAVLKVFNGTDGALPGGRLALVGGKLYGTTEVGGTNYGILSMISGDGVLFELNTNGSGFTVLTNFIPPESQPWGDLVFSDGNFYGILASGDGSGNVFVLNGDASGYRSIIQFPAGTWNVPQGLAVAGSKLYGTAIAMIFSANTDGSNFKSLHTFNLATEGFCSSGSLTVAGTTLFGTSSAPFNGTASSVFKMSTDGRDFALVKNFTNCLMGSDLLLSRGTLYGAGRSADDPTSGFIFSISLHRPAINNPPQSQTAELGTTVNFRADANGWAPLSYQWYFNGTNSMGSATNSMLELTNVLGSQSGAYTLVITNLSGSVTSSPAMLSVIPPISRQQFAGYAVRGQPGASVNIDYTTNLALPGSWSALSTDVLTNDSELFVDLTQPLELQRFYRVGQTSITSTIPSLDIFLVPGITLTGVTGNSVRLDYINRIGPTNAWVNLATVTLTNSSQIYFDFSSLGEPPRLYRVAQGP